LLGCKEGLFYLCNQVLLLLAMRTSAPETDLRKACEEKMVGGLEEK
jgi:hypothetical protein